MLKYIDKIPIVQSCIKKEDIEQIVFPITIEKLFDIGIVNELEGKKTSFLDDDLAGATNVKAKKDDKIYIEFSISQQKNIEVSMEISEIFQYSCGLKDIYILRAFRGKNICDIGGVRLNVMDRSYYIDEKNPSKLFIDIQLDIISIDANKAVISDIRYTDNQ